MADRQHWLMKSEPEEFSIDDLARVRVEPWSGVRNYMARFHMRRMRVGDEVLFHHSSVEPPGVAGLARVVRTGVLDEKQFDEASPYHDPRATREAPIWDCVDVEYVETFPHFVSMDRMRAAPECAGMLVLKRGMRLSVQPVTPEEFAAVVAMGHRPPDPAELARAEEARAQLAKGTPKKKGKAAKGTKGAAATSKPAKKAAPRTAKKAAPGTAAKAAKAAPGTAAKPAKGRAPKARPARAAPARAGRARR